MRTPMALARSVLRDCSVKQPNAAKRWPITANGKKPGQRQFQGESPEVVAIHSEITQIYEGTNQIQRMVMARQMFKR